MNKKLISGVVLAAGLLFSGSTIPQNAAAATNVGNMQLVKGQIGEVTTVQNTSLYKLWSNKKMTVVRTLKKGSSYQVYSVSQFAGITYYGVGGGCYIKASSQVKYQTPPLRYDKAYAAKNLVVKSSPGTSYKTLGTIKAGELVEVYGGIPIGWDQDNWYSYQQYGWSKVKYKNQYAYVITSQLKFANPYNWAPGVESAVINSVYANGYVSKSDKIKLVELAGSSKNGSPGFYTMYIQQNGKGNWFALVTINCKTGWYHG